MTMTKMTVRSLVSFLRFSCLLALSLCQLLVVTQAAGDIDHDGKNKQPLTFSDRATCLLTAFCVSLRGV
jgi:hypothetical protein